MVEPVFGSELVETNDPVEMIDPNWQTDKKVLAKLVYLYEQSQNIDTPDVRFCDVFNDGIHVYRGIMRLAAVAGVKTTVINNYTDQYPYRIEFEYQGVKFHQVVTAEDWDAKDY